MEFKRRWLGYDRQQVQSLLEQKTDANNTALGNTRQLMAMLEDEKEELESQLQHVQLRLAVARSRAERLEESSYIVDTMFEIMKEALAVQQGEILQIARQMADELLQRCSQLQAEAGQMDAAIALMQRQIDEKQSQYHDILSGNGEEIARINDKYQQLLQARQAMAGEINEPQVPSGLPAGSLPNDGATPLDGNAPEGNMSPMPDDKPVQAPTDSTAAAEDKPALQLVASNRREAETAPSADSSPELAPAGESAPEGEPPEFTSPGSDSVSA